MNGAELNVFAKLLKLKNWGGIFYADKIPKKLLPKKVYIINCCSSKSSTNGHHWICILAKSKSALETFDASGLDPRRIKNLKIPEGFKKIEFNGSRLQNYKSETCGLYCLYYARTRDRGVKNWNFFNRNFGKNLSQNDRLIRNWAENKLKIAN